VLLPMGTSGELGNTGNEPASMMTLAVMSTV
jgi:hypothetical protein